MEAILESREAAPVGGLGFRVLKGCSRATRTLGFRVLNLIEVSRA